MFSLTLSLRLSHYRSPFFAFVAQRWLGISANGAPAGSRSRQVAPSPVPAVAEQLGVRRDQAATEISSECFSAPVLPCDASANRGIIMGGAIASDRDDGGLSDSAMDEVWIPAPAVVAGMVTGLCPIVDVFPNM